ncbi:Uncharacterised protein [uncultured archaeon]|nr:Uncharacterised protein [uncultured archaeon]
MVSVSRLDLEDLLKAFDLTDVKLDEISFVPRGANLKTYCLIKSGDLVRKIELDEDLIKSILETPDEDLDKVLKELKLDDEALDGIVGAAKMLKSYKDKLPEDVLTVLGKACGLKLPEAKKGDQNQQKSKDDKGDNGDGGDGDNCGDQDYGYPDVGKISTEQLAKTLGEQGLNPTLTALFLKMHDDVGAANKRAAAAEIATEGMKKEKREAFYKEKAGKLANLALSEDFAKTLETLAEGHDVEFGKLYNVLLTADRLVGDSDVLNKEYGTGRGGGRKDSVIDEVYTRAKSRLSKDGNGKMTFEAAVAKILDDDSKAGGDLYNRYDKEQKQRAAAHKAGGD